MKSHIERIQELPPQYKAKGLLPSLPYGFEVEPPWSCKVVDLHSPVTGAAQTRI